MSEEAQAGTVVSRLTAAFTPPPEEPTQIDNSTPEPEQPEIVDPPAEPEAEKPAEEPEAEKLADDKPEETPEEDADDEDSPESELEYPTEEELKAKYPRSIPLKYIAETARYIAQAKEGNEIKAKLGGEPFIEPLSDIALALQSLSDPDADPQAFQPFFTGVLNAAGDTALVRVLGQAVNMAFVQAKNWAKFPGTEGVAKTLNDMVEESVQQRFGTSSDRLTAMANWDNTGWPDKLKSWTDKYAVDPDDDTLWDEFNEMLRINNDPKMKALQEELTGLKRQKETPAAEVKSDNKQDIEIENSFNEYATQAVKDVLEKVVWKNSPLRDIATDTAEMKSFKEYFRSDLEKATIQELHANTAKSKLLSGFKSGKQTTAVYKTDLTNVLDAVIKSTRTRTATAEQILAQLYGKTRNANLPQKPVLKTDTPAVPIPPTQPTNFAPPEGQPKTRAQTMKTLHDAFAEFDARPRG